MTPHAVTILVIAVTSVVPVVIFMIPVAFMQLPALPVVIIVGMVPICAFTAVRLKVEQNQLIADVE
jgi:hypothetical protein